MDVAILGLGLFGKELALELSEQGADVLAVDIDRKKLEEIKEKVTGVAVADVTDRDALSELEIQKFPIVVVCLGGHFEASILAVTALKKADIKRIIVRVSTEVQAEVMVTLGADDVVLPEKSTAHRIVHTIISPNLKETAVLSDGLALSEIKVPKTMVGKSLAELDLRKKHGITFAAQKAAGKVNPYIDAGKPLEEDEIYLVVGSNEALSKLFGQ